MIRTSVVTGGAGFLGSHICERLTDAGVSVVCMDNFLTGSPGNVAHLIGRPGFQLIECDLTNFVHVPHEVDLVLHLASASPVDYQRLPIETLARGRPGTEHALQLAREHGARFVLASTSEVYGDPDVHPQVEDYPGRVNPVGPRSVYDEAKRFAEALTAAYRECGVDTAIARGRSSTPTAPGCGGRRTDGADVRLAGAGRRVAHRTGSRRRDPLDLLHHDTVSGIIALARADFAGPVNIGNPDEKTVLELAEQIATCWPADADHLLRPVRRRPATRRPDITLARERLGWGPDVLVWRACGAPSTGSHENWPAIQRARIRSRLRHGLRRIVHPRQRHHRTGSTHQWQRRGRGM